MPLPDCLIPAAAETGPALPLHALAPARYPDWLAARGENERRFIAAAGFEPKPGRWLLLPGAQGEPAAVLAGLDDAADPFAWAQLARALPPGDYRLAADPALDPALAVLGWGLGGYRFERYRAGERGPARLRIGDAAALAETLALIAACHRVQDLVNTPTQDMGPDELEAAAAALAQAHGGTMRAIAGAALLEQNFPAIHAVGRASHRAPRLIELNWGDPAHPRIAIVGKGVCFDTGGLDLKPASGMRNMKKDMGGAAHALGLAQLVMQRALPVRLQLLIPAVENAIGPDAYRPGEVLATRKGLRVEIDNTDAEGRVVLGDALSYAAEGEPALLLDFATLTGAARIALGPDLPVLYSNDESLAADYLAAGERVRDRLWRLPLWRPYRRYFRSRIADLANAGSSTMAGSITAALYLERFLPEHLPWAHSDVYAWCDGDRPGHPAGGQAQGLRAAFELLKSRYSGDRAAVG